MSVTASSLDSPHDGDWRVFLVTSLGVFIVFMNMTTMDVALPSVVHYFSATPTQGNWILLSYMLINTVMILAFGRLADLLGRKTLYLWGVALFTLGSLLCAVSQSANMLIAFRVLQAIGAASIFTNNSALLADAFPAKKLPSVLGANASIAAMASVCGPLVGGALVHAFGWRVLFFFNVPFGVLSLIFGPMVIRHLPGSRDESFDVMGCLLSFLSLGGLIFALSEGGMLGWSSAPVVLSGVTALACGVAFVWTQLRRRHPLVDLALLRDRRLVLSYWSNFGSAATQVSVVLLISLFLQAARDMNPLEAGARIMPLAAGLMASAFLSGRLMHKVGGHRVAASGMGLLSVSMLGLMFCLDGGSRLGQMTWMLAAGVGLGLFTTPNTSAILASVAPARRGIANGLRSMMQNCGYVVGTAVSLAIVTAPLSSAGKEAIYSGQHADLAAGQIALFVGQYHAAFLMLAVLAASCAAASYLRGKIAPPQIDAP